MPIVPAAVERVGVVADDLDRPLHLVGLPAYLRLAARAAAVAAIVIGSTVLAGYVMRWRLAVDLHPSLPPMYPNPAIGFVVVGVSALLASGRRRRWLFVSRAGCVFVFVVATATFVLHVVGAGPTFLEGLWPDHPFVAATTVVPGRPVVETCVAFMSLSAAGAMLASRRAPRWTQGLALGGVSVGTAAILGYTIGVDRQRLGGSFVLVGMALHTAIGLTCLGLAVLLAQPTSGLFSRLTHSGPSARLSRRLVTVVVVAPIALTAITVWLQRATPDDGLVRSASAIVQILALGLLVMIPLSAADEMELTATATLREARALRERLSEQGVVTGALVEVLSQRPAAPPGWSLGFRQTAAFGALPGDSCQLLPTADGGFLVAVLDVAGHGTGPAMQALRLRYEIAALWQAGVSLDRIAASVDASVSEMGTITTGVLLTYDPATATCEYVNAGHPPLIAVDGATLERWDRTRPLFGGGVPTDMHAARRYVVAKGSVLVVYTDGIVESRSRDRELLGDRAVEQAIRVHAPTGPQAIADACLDVALHHSHVRLRDDALAIALRRD